MTLTANSLGEVSGRFTIPANVPAGTKRVSFRGAGGSAGDAVFVGSGMVTTETRRLVTTETLNFYDPLAQTFTLTESQQIAAVDLWFAAVGPKQVLVQIRETSNGVPTQTTLASVRVQPADINTVSHTRVIFPVPVNLLANAEYAIVALCDDAVAELRIAELGKFDSTNQRWVTSQPYQVGVLLSSSNASSWTPHQDRDLTFRLHKAIFTESTKNVALGNVAVVAATDLMLLTSEELTSSQTRIEYTLGLPDGQSVVVSGGQPVRLAAAITGNVTVSAKLTGNAAAAPVLFPGTQLVVGKVKTAGTYVSRAIKGGTAVRVKVIFEAVIPGGSAVAVSYKGADIGDVWVTVPFLGSAAVDNGFYEITHEITGITETMIQIKLDLTGSTAARPRVKNLRFMTI